MGEIGADEIGEGDFPKLGGSLHTTAEDDRAITHVNDKRIGWNVFEKPFGDYLLDFEDVDSDHKLRTLVEDLSAKRSPVIIDLMAPTATLYDFVKKYRKGKSIKGLAVGFADRRSRKTRLKDFLAGINYIATDLSQHKNFDKVENWLGYDKADLIMERAYAGLSNLPTNARFENYAIQRIFKMLNPNGGIAVLQLPPQEALTNNDIAITEWINSVRGRGIYCKYVPSCPPAYGLQRYGLLLLQRNSETDQLPGAFNNSVGFNN